MVTFVIVLINVGLIAGAIARLLLPGRDPIGIFGTIVLGIVGSFVGGFLQNLIQHHSLSIHSFHPVGIIGRGSGSRPAPSGVHWAVTRAAASGRNGPSSRPAAAQARASRCRTASS